MKGSEETSSSHVETGVMSTTVKYEKQPPGDGWAETLFHCVAGRLSLLKPCF